MQDDSHDRFTGRYAADDIPWDSGITPPELMEAITELPAGAAIDLGCGTGTNTITLAQHQWQATGIDFVEQAILTARTKADRAKVSQRTTFHVGDVRDLSPFGLSDLDLAVDIGCGHVFGAEGFGPYMQEVASVLKTGATWMLYIHHYKPESQRGLDPDIVLSSVANTFDVIYHHTGVDSTDGEGSSWFRLVRTAS